MRALRRRRYALTRQRFPAVVPALHTVAREPGLRACPQRAQLRCDAPQVGQLAGKKCLDASGESFAGNDAS